MKNNKEIEQEQKKRFLEYLKKYDIDALTLSKKSRISKRECDRYESGEKMPKLANLCKITTAFPQMSLNFIIKVS